MKKCGVPRHLKSLVWKLFLNIDSIQKMYPEVKYEVSLIGMPINGLP